MPWFAAHAVMYLKLKEAPQTSFTVWENVLLIQASDPDTAVQEARARALLDAGDSNGSLRVGDQPAEWLFAGIRKLVTVFHMAPDDTLASGDEITYSEFIVPDEATIHRLAAGEEVTLTYSDGCPPESPRSA